MTAETGDRSYYLDRFADEILPCDTTLAAWAEWLSKPDDEWNRGEFAKDGDRFSASVTIWHPDIIATRTDGKWSFSRDPEEGDFVAVRYGPGSGWSPDNIVWDGDDTVNALRNWFADPDNDVGCDDLEHVAVGKHGNKAMLIYRADPPRLIVEGAIQ